MVRLDNLTPLELNRISALFTTVMDQMRTLKKATEDLGVVQAPSQSTTQYMQSGNKRRRLE